MYDSILIATDGSDSATHAVRHAIQIAGTYGATLHVLCVIDVRVLESVPHLEHVEEAVQNILEAVQNQAERAGVAVVTGTRNGIPHEEILAYAIETGIDLIIVGSHGTSGLERFLLGSTADRVMRLAEVPVMIVPHPDIETGVTNS